jgi:hypothetical protein
MNNPPPEVTLRTLSSGSPIVDTGTLGAVWTISIDGKEVSRTTKLMNTGREVSMPLLFSISSAVGQVLVSSDGVFTWRSWELPDPTPLPSYMELFA